MRDRDVERKGGISGRKKWLYVIESDEGAKE